MNRVEDLLCRVERAGADVSVDDSKGGYRKSSVGLLMGFVLVHGSPRRREGRIVMWDYKKIDGANCLK